MQNKNINSEGLVPQFTSLTMTEQKHLTGDARKKKRLK